MTQKLCLWLIQCSKQLLKKPGHHLRWACLRAKIFAFVAPEDVARDFFAFGSGNKKFSRQSEKILAPFFRDLGTTIGVFLARKNKSNSFADIDSMDQHRNSMASCREDSLHLKKLKLALYRIQIYNC